MTMQLALLLLGGLVLLVVGGQLLVSGAVRAAERLGVSPLMIGLTLVGFGTSTPELVTSVRAASIGQPGIAVGNIVGSNIANLLLILGVSALCLPITVPRRALMRDGGVVVVSALVLAAVSYWYELDRLVGVLLLGLLVAYLTHAYRQERAGPEVHTAAFDRSEASEQAIPHRGRERSGGMARELTVALGIAIGGLALVVLGGTYFVDGAVGLARSLGVSETTIGLTIVAIGTSLPELVTSIIAALRKQGDMALGNILGSNIYNTLGIGGVTGILSPVIVPEQIAKFDNPIMVVVSALVFVFAFTGLRISRLEGFGLLACYAVYVALQWP